MIKYFNVPTKFIQVSWGDLDEYDEVWYTISHLPDMYGPFLVINKANGILQNFHGKKINTDSFNNPITLFQRIA